MDWFDESALRCKIHFKCDDGTMKHPNHCDDLQNGQL